MAAMKKKDKETEEKPISEKNKKEDARKAEKKKPEKKGKKTSDTKKKSGFKYLGGLLFAKMMQGGASELRANAEEVNKLNVFPVPDGDTGDNMSMTIDSGVAALSEVETDDLGEVMTAASRGMLLGARGNSGVILSQFFAGLAQGFEHSNKADPRAVGRALEMGVEKAYASVMTPTEGTILTVAREAVEYAVSRITPKSTIHSLFSDLVKEMKRSLKRTPELLAALKEAGVVDSGGAGLYFIMDGINRTLNGENVDLAPTRVENLKKNAENAASFDKDSEMLYGYCTEMLLQLMTKKGDPDAFDLEALKSFLSDIGDSVVAFKTDSIVKLHVHTMTPDKVLAYGLQFGEFISVKIENMSLQHSETVVKEETDTAPAPTTPEVKEKKKYAVVGVTNGEGIDAVYRDLGCDETVAGGQCSNPSTSDFLEAFERISAENIFVLPNNSNVIMAAGQAAEIYTGATVRVIPTKNVAEGYAVLSTMPLDSGTPEEIVEASATTLSATVTASVTTSVRDAEIGGVEIHDHDTIGIIAKEIVVSESDPIAATRAVLTRLFESGDRFMLTVLYGKDSTEEERADITSFLSESFPEIECYFIDAGQEIYPYVFLAE